LLTNLLRDVERLQDDKDTNVYDRLKVNNIVWEFHFAISNIFVKLTQLGTSTKLFIFRRYFSHNPSYLSHRQDNDDGLIIRKHINRIK